MHLATRGRGRSPPPPPSRNRGASIPTSDPKFDEPVTIDAEFLSQISDSLGSKIKKLSIQNSKTKVEKYKKEMK